VRIWDIAALRIIFQDKELPVAGSEVNDMYSPPARMRAYTYVHARIYMRYQHVKYMLMNPSLCLTKAYVCMRCVYGYTYMCVSVRLYGDAELRAMQFTVDFALLEDQRCKDLLA
jgi:hypothetical protein